MAEPISTIATGVAAATAAGQKVGEYGAEKAIEAWDGGWERHDEAVGAMFSSPNYELEEAEG